MAFEGVNQPAVASPAIACVQRFQLAGIVVAEVLRQSRQAAAQEFAAIGLFVFFGKIGKGELFSRAVGREIAEAITPGFCFPPYRWPWLIPRVSVAGSIFRSTRKRRRIRWRVTPAIYCGHD